MKNIPFKVFPSSANFVFVDVAPLKSKDVCTRLLKRGVIVRDCSSFRGAGDRYVRISAGTREQNERVVKFLSAIKFESRRL
jgi:histidinol-phosphate aminotransferase